MTASNTYDEWRRNNPLIDMHTHIDPDHVEHAIELMDQNSIDQMVEISFDTGETFERRQEALAEYPDRFAYFSGLDFSDFGTTGWLDRELDRMEAAVDAGVVGFKVHKALGLEVTDPSGSLVTIDDERLAPLFEKAAELDVVFAFHTADPKAFFEPLTPENERYDELSENPEWWWGDRTEYPYDWWQLIRQLERVIGRHPETTFLGAHFGCAAEEVGYAADVMRQHPNFIVDVSARLAEIGRHDASFVQEIFLEFQDRILFGTDLGIWESLILGAPQDFEPTDEDTADFYDAHWQYFETAAEGIAHPTPIQGDWPIDAIDLPKDVLEKFYAENARRYFDL